MSVHSYTEMELVDGMGHDFEGNFKPKLKFDGWITSKKHTVQYIFGMHIYITPYTK
jgi:hypothetical protein